MPKPSMLEQVQKHSTALWHIHANPDGYAWCLSQSQTPPTREEAEGKYDRLNRPATVSTDI